MKQILINNIEKDIEMLEQITPKNEVDTKNFTDLLKQLNNLKEVLTKSGYTQKINDIYSDLKLPINVFLKYNL